jgi:3'-5' exoribonuclease 1
MRYIIVDLEATCDKQGFPRTRMETIEIGAVAWTPEDGAGAEFAAFIKPVATQELSAFCTKLTGITQQDVDAAEPFYTVFPQFVEWCESGGEPITFCSWGEYDKNQLRQDCERHKMAFPEILEKHINFKKAFSRIYDKPPTGMMGALRHLGIEPEGQQHRGIDDARNIAKIAAHVLTKEEE